MEVAQKHGVFKCLKTAAIKLWAQSFNFEINLKLFAVLSDNHIRIIKMKRSVFIGQLIILED